MITSLMLFAGLVLDGGLALRGRVLAIDQAQEAARAGAQHIDLDVYRRRGVVVLDVVEARRAARSYLAAADALDASGRADAAAQAVVVVASDRVTVTVTRRQRTQLLTLIGMGSLRVSGVGTAVAAHGIDAPEP